MSDIIKQMWKIYLDCINPKNNKIICPITGGLDSRVLAYALSLKGYRFISYYVYTDKTQQNLYHIKDIVNHCNVSHVHYIYTENFMYKPEIAIKFLSEKYHLKEYDRYIAVCNDVITGLRKRKLSNRRYWFEKDVDLDDIRKNYKNLIDPTGSQKWVGFCYSLPLHLRLFQRGYIEMIKRFTPLGNIPRCFEGGQAPCLIDKGMIYYAAHRCHQKLLK